MRRRFQLLVALLLVGGGLRAGAARLLEEDASPPRPLTLRLRDPYLELEAEGDESRTRLPDAPAERDITQDWTPSVGLGLDGSLYHVRLLQFSADLELGVTEGERRRDDGTGPEVRSDRSFTVQRYNATLVFLRAKPYSLTVFGRRDVQQRDYDQFNRFDVEHDHYGAQVRHSGERLGWELRFARTREDITDTDRPSHDDEKLVTLDARYRRGDDDRTTLRYSFRDYARRESGGFGYAGEQQTLNVMDELQSRDDRNRLVSTFNATDLNDSTADYRTRTLREDFRRRQRERLWLGASYQYDWRETGGSRTEQHEAELFADHRLYESLDSRLDLQIEQSRTREEQAVDDFLRYGPGLAENYTKRLGWLGRLSIDLSVRFDRIVRETAGAGLRILDEPLRLTDGRPALLSQPNVRRDTIFITDDSGLRVYRPGFDYRVIGRGSFTEIQRTFGGAIPNDSVVRVDYTVRGAASDALHRLEQRAGFTIDLLERLLYLYGTWREVRHRGGEDTVFQDQRETVLGLKSRWRWVEVGLEQLDYQADTLSYEGPHYFAELTFDGDGHTLKLHAGRTELTYRDQENQLDTVLYTLMYDWHPVTQLSLQLFAGDFHETTGEGERDWITLESRLVWTLHRLTLEGIYRYEDEEQSDEDHERRYYLLRVRRAL